ncbi:hypothetical protein KDA_41290 [Dictyobacter alpinus]|uniref:Yip1 domain-containing protein n=1 Tax=Dictyobacter alpinus TaxID=2014873 RepID=A0A402BBB9_9CHLR|nr:YIP1 family protein [Dictyobacter alpinus]GCE28645.1 hypothetical protein KDA_41290 [Dictyobacter alpinus]
MADATYELNSAQKPRFGQALAALPGQYLKVLTHPSIKTFEEEKDKGSWGLVWFQLLLLGVISAFIIVLAYAIAPPDVSSVARSSGISVQDARNALVITFAILIFILTPITFLLSGGILYLIARIAGSKGTYLQQIWVTLLFGVPLALLSTLLYLIPVTNQWLPWVPHIYSVVLIILAMIAVHRRKMA